MSKVSYIEIKNPDGTSVRAYPNAEGIIKVSAEHAGREYAVVTEEKVLPPWHTDFDLFPAIPPITWEEVLEIVSSVTGNKPEGAGAFLSDFAAACKIADKLNERFGVKS